MFKKRNDFDQYLKNVRISFPVFHKAERRFFQDFSANVREYQAIHPMRAKLSVPKIKFRSNLL